MSIAFFACQVLAAAQESRVGLRVRIADLGARSVILGAMSMLLPCQRPSACR